MVSNPTGGWAPPWPDVAEIEKVLPLEHWTLIGGLMVQLWSVHYRVNEVRATRDVDMAIHIETARGRQEVVASALEGLGYELDPPGDPRKPVAHRFRRDQSLVDVVLADHAAPRVVPKLRGKKMVQFDGVTQALRRTVNAVLEIVPGRQTEISVPDPFGALILKAAAHKADSRDSGRHLQDAAVLLACVEDPFTAGDPSSASDRSRLLHLHRELSDPLHTAWQLLPAETRNRARDTLTILMSDR